MSEKDTRKVTEMPKHGDFCWSEIAVTDLAKCRPFYESVFGWTFDKSRDAGDEMEYLEFSSSSTVEKDGALYQMNEMMFGGQVPPSHMAQYVAVDDVDSAVEKAKQLGGSVRFGPYDIPHVGRFALINDPTGAAVSLITLEETA